MCCKSRLPPLQVTENGFGWIYELRPTHWAGDWTLGVLLVLCPYFKAFGVHALMAGLAR